MRRTRPPGCRDGHPQHHAPGGRRAARPGSAGWRFRGGVMADESHPAGPRPPGLGRGFRWSGPGRGARGIDSPLLAAAGAASVKSTCSAWLACLEPVQQAAALAGARLIVDQNGPRMSATSPGRSRVVAIRRCWRPRRGGDGLTGAGHRTFPGRAHRSAPRSSPRSRDDAAGENQQTDPAMPTGVRRRRRRRRRRPGEYEAPGGPTARPEHSHTAPTATAETDVTASQPD